MTSQPLPLPFKSAARFQHSILTPIEKRTLQWLAARMPAWVNSDHLTLLGFVGMFLTGVSYYLARRDSRMLLVGVLCLAINWFGDSLDGTLARYRNRQRPRYGYYVDHIVDAFGAVFLFGGMGLSGYMTPSVAMLLLIAYFLLFIEIYLATHATGVFRLSFGIFGPSELRVLLAIGSLALFFKPRVTLFGHAYLLYDVGGSIAAAGIAVVTIFAAIRNTRQLYNEERLP